MRIAIAGAGIAGLTASIALARRGVAVDLHERSAVLEEVGAGIQLSPNAVMVLERLEVFDDIADTLVEPEAIEIRDARNGARLARIPLGKTARRRYGAPYCVIHRADLQAGLLAAAKRQSAIRLRLDAPVGAIGETPRGVAFNVKSEPHGADALIAADGLRSAIRTEHFGHPGPQSLHRAAWRTTLPAAAVPSPIGLDATGLWLGPGGHLVHYPVRGGQNLNVVVIATGTGDTPLPEPFGREARRLIDAVDTWTPWPLFGVDPTLEWTRGRVALIGDAAHAMAPSAAQGGAQAIEDSWVLAAALAAHGDDPAAALEAYERTRRSRVERVVREARQNLGIYNMRGLPATIRNAVLRRMSPERLLSRLDWLYGWTPQ